MVDFGDVFFKVDSEQPYLLGHSTSVCLVPVKLFVLQIIYPHRFILSWYHTESSFYVIFHIRIIFYVVKVQGIHLPKQRKKPRFLSKTVFFTLIHNTQKSGKT